MIISRSKMEKLLLEAFRRGFNEAFTECGIESYTEKIKAEGVKEERDRMMQIIDQMQESAEALMQWEWAFACQQFRNQVQFGEKKEQ